MKRKLERYNRKTEKYNRKIEKKIKASAAAPGRCGFSCGDLDDCGKCAVFSSSVWCQASKTNCERDCKGTFCPMTPSTPPPPPPSPPPIPIPPPPPPPPPPPSLECEGCCLGGLGDPCNSCTNCQVIPESSCAAKNGTWCGPPPPPQMPSNCNYVSGPQCTAQSDCLAISGSGSGSYRIVTCGDCLPSPTARLTKFRCSNETGKQGSCKCRQDQS